MQPAYVILFTPGKGLRDTRTEIARPPRPELLRETHRHVILFGTSHIRKYPEAVR